MASAWCCKYTRRSCDTTAAATNTVLLEPDTLLTSHSNAVQSYSSLDRSHALLLITTGRVDLLVASNCVVIGWVGVCQDTVVLLQNKSSNSKVVVLQNSGGATTDTTGTVEPILPAVVPERRHCCEGMPAGQPGPSW